MKVELRFLAEPSSVNFGNKVHGGSVMKWIDQAGYTCAVKWSGKYSVTAYVGGVSFKTPIYIGELVEAEATLIHTGKTSMHILVKIKACDPKTSNFRETASCYMVFVAVDDNGLPVEVPKFESKNEKIKKMTENLINIEKESERIKDELLDIV
jgi:acyl-CoA hydrolase